MFFSCGHATLYEALSVRPSVHPLLMIASKSVKTRIYDAAVMIVGMREHGMWEGMDGGFMPLPGPSVRDDIVTSGFVHIA